MSSELLAGSSPKAAESQPVTEAPQGQGQPASEPGKTDDPLDGSLIQTQQQQLRQSNKEPRKSTTSSNGSQRKNIFASKQKFRDSVSSVENAKTCTKNNDSVNELQNDINLLQNSTTVERKSRKQFLPRRTHSNQRQQMSQKAGSENSRRSGTKVPAIQDFEQALRLPQDFDTNVEPLQAVNKSQILSKTDQAGNGDLDVSVRSKISDKPKRSRKIKIDEFGYSRDHLKRAKDSVSQMSRGSSGRRPKK